MWRNIAPAFRIALVMTVLTGLAYPAVVTILCRALFPRQAAGSLVRLDGAIAGSELLGQSFTRPEYFHPRPSAAGNGYDPLASGGSNLGPMNPKLAERVKGSIAQFSDENAPASRIPADAVTASGSGLDPHISPATAAAQVDRVARMRGAPAAEIRRMAADREEGRTLGLLGEPRVNVLLLNLDLDRRFPMTRQ